MSLTVKRAECNSWWSCNQDIAGYAFECDKGFRCDQSGLSQASSCGYHHTSTKPVLVWIYEHLSCLIMVQIKLEKRITAIELNFIGIIGS